MSSNLLRGRNLDGAVSLFGVSDPEERRALDAIIAMRLNGIDTRSCALALAREFPDMPMSRVRITDLCFRAACLRQYEDVRRAVAAKWTGGDVYKAALLLGEAAVSHVSAAAMARGEKEIG